MERAASKCAPPGMESSALRGAEDASLFNPKISWMPKPVHLGACDVMLFDKCGLLFPPFSTIFGLFKLSNNTAPSFPVMVPLRIVLCFPCAQESTSANTRDPPLKFSFYPKGPSLQGPEVGSQSPASKTLTISPSLPHLVCILSVCQNVIWFKYFILQTKCQKNSRLNVEDHYFIPRLLIPQQHQHQQQQ